MSEWDVVKDYVSKYPKAEVFYKVDYVDEESARIRVLCGRLAFDQVVRGKETVEGQLRFLEERGGKAVVRQREYDSFFL
jgi:hypothetical protein